MSNFPVTPIYHLDIHVQSHYLEEQSQPDANQFAFSYTVTITNAGTIPVQLISRHWVITDAHNNVQEVKGLGVVGHQPFLKPKEGFEYSSGSSLSTSYGTMRGHYFCVAEDGHRFEVEIPEFVLTLPRTLH